MNETQYNHIKYCFVTVIALQFIFFIFTIMAIKAL